MLSPLTNNKLKLPHRFDPRPYQIEKFNKFFKEGLKNQVWVDHRRSGKTLNALNIVIGEACRVRGLYLCLFPLATQLRKVVWRGQDSDGISFLDRIPKQIMAKPANNTELYVSLINGSIIQCIGTDEPDSLRGMGARGVWWSEFQNHNPRAYEVLKPMIVQTKGWQIIEGTPLGKNHFYHRYQALKKLEGWYVKTLTVNDTTHKDGTRLITEQEIQNERDEGTSEESIRQEYYCDWNVGIQGAYYTNQLDSAEEEGRISVFDINPNLPVFTAWDLGVSDATSIWFFQQNGPYIDFVYYLEKTDQGPEYYAAQLRDLSQRFGFRYRNHYGPHDLMQRKWGYSARSSMSLAREAGINFLLVPNIKVEDGIQASRAILPYCRFHVEHCALGLQALKEYRREWDPEHKVFRQKPLHNWASNAADAFRYFAVYWDKNFTRPDLGAQTKYQMDF